MLQLNKYGVLILDCDGVIFNSNNLKIKAMEIALCKESIGNQQLVDCIDFFKIILVALASITLSVFWTK